MEEEYLCHSCNEPAEGCCTSCEQPVCCDCTMEFTQMNQIDYDLCRNCNDDYEEERAEAHHQNEIIYKLSEKYGVVEGMARYFKHKKIVASLTNKIKTPL